MAEVQYVRTTTSISSRSKREGISNIREVFRRFGSKRAKHTKISPASAQIKQLHALHPPTHDPRPQSINSRTSVPLQSERNSSVDGAIEIPQEQSIRGSSNGRNLATLPNQDTVIAQGDSAGPQLQTDSEHPDQSAKKQKQHSDRKAKQRVHDDGDALPISAHGSNKVVTELPSTLPLRSQPPLQDSTPAELEGTILSLVPDPSRSTDRSPLPQVEVPCNSIQINLFEKTAFGERLYVGKLRDLRPEKTICDKWKAEIFRRLNADITPILQAFVASQPSRSRGPLLEPILCMSGRAPKNAKTVELRPAIWLQCSDKKLKSEIEHAIKDLQYLRDFIQDNIEVHCRPPVLAIGVVGSTESLESALPDGFFATHDGTSLRIHVKRRANSTSACGLLLRLTFVKDGCITQHCTSVLGGLVSVDGTVYGLSTGHAMIEPTLNEQDLRAAPAYVIDNSQGNDEDWQEIQIFQNVCYAGRELFPAHNLTTEVPLVDADFVLLDYPSARYVPLHNTYTNPETGKSVLIKRAAQEDEFPEGPTWIITPDNRPIQAYLLPMPSAFFTADAVYCTRKLQLNKPLERGMSGSWVVSGNLLLGVIIAVYEDDHYAHMITAEKMFSDIRDAYSPVKNVDVQVATLPGRGVVEPVDNDLVIEPVMPNSFILTRNINVQNLPVGVPRKRFDEKGGYSSESLPPLPKVPQYDLEKSFGRRHSGCNGYTPATGKENKIKALVAFVFIFIGFAITSLIIALLVVAQQGDVSRFKNVLGPVIGVPAALAAITAVHLFHVLSKPGRCWA